MARRGRIGGAPRVPAARRAGAARTRPRVVPAEPEPPQPRLHRLTADVEPGGEPRRVVAVLDDRLAHEVLGHEELGGELVGLALLLLPRLVDGAAALGREAPGVEHEVADLVRDREPAAALVGGAAHHDRVAVAQRLQGALAQERLARGLHDLEVERAHDVAQRDGLARDAGALQQAGGLQTDVGGRMTHQVPRG